MIHTQTFSLSFLPFLLLFLKSTLTHTAHAHINIQTETHSSIAGTIVGIAYKSHTAWGGLNTDAMSI